MTVESLKMIRDQIDDIDRKMQELFIQRMKLVSEISVLKRAQNLEILDPEREKAMIRIRMDCLAGSPYSAHYLRFLEFVLRESRILQEERRK